MKVVKQDSEFGIDIFFKEENKYLAITYGGNLDLYWIIYSEEVNKDNNFVITKENYEVYRLFEQLFNDIDDINIYKYQNHQFSSNFKKAQKEKYRKSNTSNYNVLYNEKEKLITWYSDETAFCVANVLKIKKEDEIFKLEFFIQPYIDGYDRDFNSLHHIPIRFRNSGSFYNPFNVVFMRMYSNMKEIDDVNDYGHQIHMEEYLYSQSKIKKLTK